MRPFRLPLASLALLPALALSGCFLLPEGPVPTASPTAAPEPVGDAVLGTLTHCTNEIMQIVLQVGAGDPDDVRTVREIEPAEFVPYSLGGVLYGSCAYELKTVEVGGRTTVSQGAFVPGGFSVFDDIDTRLRASLYEDSLHPVSRPTPSPTSTPAPTDTPTAEPTPDAVETAHATMGEYHNADLDYVVVWHSGGPEMLVEFTGPAFEHLGDEYIQLYSVVLFR